MTDEHSSPSEGRPEVVAEENPERRKRRYVANLAFGAIKAQHSAHRTILERAVDKLNEIASSVWFLVGHVVAFAFWILWNTGAIGLQPVDPYPFGLMTTIVSLEAIFLSIFVLVSQNRQAAKDRLRSDAEYEVNLKAELEITQLHEKVDFLTEELLARIPRRERDRPPARVTP